MRSDYSIDHPISYSDDVWDYIEDMDYMPTRRDRDDLVKKAQHNPEEAKRVRIWDTFFQIQPEDVAIPQKKEISELNQSRKELSADFDDQLIQLDKEYRINSSNERDKHQKIIEQLEEHLLYLRNEQDVALKRRNIGLITFLFGVGIAIAEYLGVIEIVNLMMFVVTGAISLTGLFLLLSGVTRWLSIENKMVPETQLQIEQENERYKNAINRLDQQYHSQRQNILDDQQTTLRAIDERIEKLNQQINQLLRQIPQGASAQELTQWLQEDIEHLSSRAIEMTGLRSRLVKLKDDTPNPLCIMAPAELQEYIPEILMRDEDKKKHLHVHYFAPLPDGGFSVFHGVYYMEFILIATDMLGTYGCFWDFISGYVVNERTSEQYYSDVVAINTQRDYKEIAIVGTSLEIENIPTFSLSLSSGERRQVTFASESYVKEIKKRIEKDSPEEDEDDDDDEQWVDNPEQTAENAIKALRAKLREHKGLQPDGGRL